MSGALIEVTLLHVVSLCLSIILLYLQLRLVVLRLSMFSLPFFLWFGASLSLLMLLGISKPKMSCILFNIMLEFDNISIGHAQGRYVQKIHLCLDVSIQTIAVL
jgi:hypothetical protein